MVFPPKELSKQLSPTSLEVDTFEGKIHVEWESECYEPLLTIPWILDTDVTTKTIHENQEGVEKGFITHTKKDALHALIILT